MPTECCKKFYARIPEDVPIFTLVAWDLLALEAIQQWLLKARDKGVSEEKIAKAQQHFDAIALWQRENPSLCKLPD